MHVTPVHFPHQLLSFLLPLLVLLTPNLAYAFLADPLKHLGSNDHQKPLLANNGATIPSTPISAAANCNPTCPPGMMASSIRLTQTDCTWTCLTWTSMVLQALPIILTAVVVLVLGGYVAWDMSRAKKEEDVVRGKLKADMQAKSSAEGRKMK